MNFFLTFISVFHGISIIYFIGGGGLHQEVLGVSSPDQTGS